MEQPSANLKPAGCCLRTTRAGVLKRPLAETGLAEARSRNAQPRPDKSENVSECGASIDAGLTDTDASSSRP